MSEELELRIARLISDVRDGLYPPAAVLDELRNADVFAPVQSQPAHPNDDIRMPSFRDKYGSRYVILFTSLTRLESWAPLGSFYAQLAFGTLSQNWPAKTMLVLNPGGELAISFAPDEVVQPPVHAVSLTTRLYVREPSTEPTAARNRVRQLCALRRWVRAAYRAEIFLPGSGEVPHLAIGISLDDGVEEVASFAREIAITCTEVGVAPVSIIPLNATGNDNLPICKFMLLRTRAWYERTPSSDAVAGGG